MCGGLPAQLHLEAYMLLRRVDDWSLHVVLPLSVPWPLLLSYISNTSSHSLTLVLTEPLLSQLILDLPPFGRICHFCPFG